MEAPPARPSVLMISLFGANFSFLPDPNSGPLPVSRISGEKCERIARWNRESCDPHLSTCGFLFRKAWQGFSFEWNSKKNDAVLMTGLDVSEIIVIDFEHADASPIKIFLTFIKVWFIREKSSKWMKGFLFPDSKIGSTKNSLFFQIIPFFTNPHVSISRAAEPGKRASHSFEIETRWEQKTEKIWEGEGSWLPEKWKSILKKFPSRRFDSFASFHSFYCAL